MSTESEQDSLLSSLSSISRGGIIFIGGSAVSKLLGFGFNLLLTRFLGVNLYGIYAFANTVQSLLSDFGTIGSERAILRFLPVEVEEGSSQSVVLGLGYVTTLVGSTCLGVALFWFAPVLAEFTLDSPLFVNVIRIFALVIPLRSLMAVTLSVFRSLERLEYQVFVNSIVTQSIKILTTGAALLLGASLMGVVAAIAAAMLIVFIYAIYLLLIKTKVRPTLGGYKDTVREYYDYSLPLAMKDIGGLVVSRVDILMIGFLLSDQAVGIYNIALLISGLLLFPTRGFNQLVPPIISRLYEDGNFDQMQSIYSVIARWVLIITLVPAIGIIVYRNEILAVFGPSFTLGSTTLVVLCLGYLVKSTAGPSGYILMMTDHHYLTLVNQYLMASINIVLNYVLILRFGFLGAAIATAASMSAINILRVIEIWYTERLFPYTTAFLKTIVSGLLMGIVLVGIQESLTGYLSLVIGACIGPMVFAGCLYGLGLEEIDLEFLSTLSNQVQSRL